MNAKRPVTNFSIEAIIGHIGNQLTNCCATSPKSFITNNSPKCSDNHHIDSSKTTPAQCSNFMQSFHSQNNQFNQFLQQFDIAQLNNSLQTQHQNEHQFLYPLNTQSKTKQQTNAATCDDEDEIEIDVVNVDVNNESEEKNNQITSNFKTIDDEDLSFYQYAPKSVKRHRPKKHICPICRLSLSNRGQLISHIRSHTGERPFKCDHPTCSKAFTRNEELTRHKRIHTGQKPYPCYICSKRFGRKDHLKKHIRTHTKRGLPQQLFSKDPSAQLGTTATSLNI